MSDRFHFTQQSVENAICPLDKKDVMFFDTETRGFGMRVTKVSRTFQAQFRTAGGSRRVAIGAFGVLTVAEARKRAKVILGAAADGRDVVAERKAKDEAEREAAREAAYTFTQLINDWAEARRGERRPSYLAEAVKCCNRNLIGWGKRSASSISAKEAMHELVRLKTGKGTTSANRTRAYASAAYGWGVGQHLIKENPFKGLARPGRETSRDRVLTAADLRVIWAAAGRLSNLSGNYIRILMLTLQRREEVAGMQWSELSLDGETWTLPGARAKNGRTTLVHLTEPARAIVAAMPRVKDNPYVFAGTKQGRPIRGFNSAKMKLDAAIKALGAQIEPWSFHDFRRAGVTALAGMGHPPHVCDRILNHITGSIQGVAAVYQRHEFLTERKAALDAWAAAVVGAAGDASVSGNVVLLCGLA